MKPRLKNLVFILSTIILVACGPELPLDSPLAEREKLVVLTRNSPMTYYIDRDEKPAGYEYDLTQALGESLGLQIEYKVIDSLRELLEALENGEGDLAAANLTDTAARRKAFLTSPGYHAVDEEIVCRRQGPVPDSVDELKEVSLIVPEGSSYIDTLNRLKETEPELSWETLDDGGTEAALEGLLAGDADCTVADSNIVAVNRRYYPELDVAFALPDELQLVWLMPKEQEPLANYLQEWIPKAKKDGLLDRLDERYYAYIPVFDFVDTRALKRRLSSRLDDYWDEFMEAGEQHVLPPTLLAAVAYQESHWDPKAKSPTGVRGMMMLTRATAKHLGVKDRLDPTESIFGGAKYLRELYDRLPEDIALEDRYWFALAAYNLGMGHLYDARKLAAQRGLDKNRWRDLREVLPLLGHRDVYKDLRHGYARGHEAVRYVRRVRNYWDIIRLNKERI